MAKKQSSRRLSSLAGKILRSLRKGRADYVLWEGLYDGDASFTNGDVRKLAASVLSQDEVKGNVVKLPGGRSGVIVRTNIRKRRPK